MPNTKTHCKRGHLLADGGIYMDSKDRVYCRACRSTPEQRLLSKVNKDGPLPGADTLAAGKGPCWLWTGYLNKQGYGRFRILAGESMDGAHRASYLLLVGPIPDGLYLDHLCQLPSCVNPDHLEPVLPRVNVLRGNGPAALNARKTLCKHGHEFTPENTFLYGNHRRCLACLARRQRTAA